MGKWEITSEPLDALAVCNLVSSDIYASSHRCFAIAAADMFISSFFSLSCKGHFECIMYIYEYISRIKHAMLQVKAGKSSFLWCSCIWAWAWAWLKLVYTPVNKEVLLDALIPTNPLHDILVRQSVTGIMHLLNQISNDWYSKKQAAMETVTCRSEVVAAST